MLGAFIKGNFRFMKKLKNSIRSVSDFITMQLDSKMRLKIKKLMKMKDKTDC